jgi:ankyrin repeat protein
MQLARQGATRQGAQDYFLDEIAHHVYRGDTALHVAAAAYQTQLVRDLVATGAGVGVRNRRGATPLHYAVDGGPGATHWHPAAQAATVEVFVALGADPDAADKNGTPPLLRAVRNRCAAAVAALLDGGADPHATNANGSNAMDLAARTTGRGGSGSPEAKAQQEQIVALLTARGVAPSR